MSQLFNDQEIPLKYEEFLSHYKILVTAKKYAIVFGAIPFGIMFMKGCNNKLSQIVPHLNVLDTYVVKLSLTTKSKNRSIRALVQNEVVSCPNAIFYWNRHVGEINWARVWVLPQKFFLYNKIKEVSYKMIHRCYPTILMILM